MRVIRHARRCTPRPCLPKKIADRNYASLWSEALGTHPNGEHRPYSTQPSLCSTLLLSSTARNGSDAAVNAVSGPTLITRGDAEFVLAFDSTQPMLHNHRGACRGRCTCRGAVELRRGLVVRFDSWQTRT